MNDIRVLRLRFKMHSEISAREDLPARNIYPVAGSISGKKVRGALLTALRREISPYEESKKLSLQEYHSSKFYKDIVQSFLNASPALPSSNETNPREIPRAPFSYLTCKICSTNQELELFDGTHTLLKRGDLAEAKFCTIHDEDYFRKGFAAPVCLTSKKPLETPWISMRPAITMDNVTGSVQSGGLYFSQTMSFENQLVTEITVSSGEMMDIITSLKDNRGLIQLGAGRARGWGIVEIDKIEFTKTLDQFVKDKQNIIECVIEKYGGFAFIARTGVGDIDTQSGIPKTTPIVREVGGYPIEIAYGRTMSVTGWSMATNLQKPRVTVAQPGSVFFYRVTNPNDVDYVELFKHELTGIGQNRMKRSQLNQVVFWEG